MLNADVGLFPAESVPQFVAHLGSSGYVEAVTTDGAE